MISKDNFPNAYKETFVILNNMEGTAVSQIPQSFMDMIKEKMNNEYDFKLDENIYFEQQTILKETKVILTYIFMHFWATEEQKRKVNKKFIQDINQNNNLLEQNYNPDDLFKKHYEKNEALSSDTLNNEILKSDNLNNAHKEETQLIVYKKDSIFRKIFDLFKRIIKGTK